jgi:ATP-dependent Lhr-like helicase
VAVLAATDPANPYGATLKFPRSPSTQNPQSSQNSHGRSKKDSADSADAASSAIETTDTRRAPTRSVGATVILVNGAIAAYLARGDRQLITFLPDAEPDRSKAARAIARVLIDRARSGGDAPRGMLIEEIDGAPPAPHPMSAFLAEAGFIGGALGMQATFRRTLARQEG